MSRHKYILLTLAVVIAVAVMVATTADYQSAPWGWFIAWRWAEGGVSFQWTGRLSIWSLGDDAGRLWPPGEIPAPEPVPWPESIPHRRGGGPVYIVTNKLTIEVFPTDVGVNHKMEFIK